MWKLVLAGTTALAIAGGTLAFAQQGPGPRDPGGPGPHWRPSVEDRAAFADARIAALHAGLKLSAEQEKDWPAVEVALHDLMQQRDRHVAARADAGPPQDPIERLNRAADAIQAQGAALKTLAAAAAPLYRGLDDAQKHRLLVLARVLRPHGRPDGFGRHGHHGRWHGEPDGGWQRMFGPGPGGPDGGRERL